MVSISSVKVNDTVCVIWRDALGDTRVDLEEVKSIPPSQLLVETKTYGTVLSRDEGAILVAQESSDSGGDYTVIPIGMITDIEILDKTVKGGKKNERKRIRKRSR